MRKILILIIFMTIASTSYSKTNNNESYKYYPKKAINCSTYNKYPNLDDFSYTCKEHISNRYTNFAMIWKDKRSNKIRCSRTLLLKNLKSNRFDLQYKESGTYGEFTSKEFNKKIKCTKISNPDIYFIYNKKSNEVTFND